MVQRKQLQSLCSQLTWIMVGMARAPSKTTGWWRQDSFLDLTSGWNFPHTKLVICTNNCFRGTKNLCNSPCHKRTICPAGRYRITRMEQEAEGGLFHPLCLVQGICFGLVLLITGAYLCYIVGSLQPKAFLTYIHTWTVKTAKPLKLCLPYKTKTVKTAE